MFIEDLGIIEECLNKYDARIRSKHTIQHQDNPLLAVEEEKVDVDEIENGLHRKET